MKLKTFFLSLVGIIALATSFSSCNSDSDDNGNSIYTIIATFEKSNAQGSVFTYRKEGDEPLITLTSTQSIKTDMFKEGTRVLLQFVTNMPPYTSGPIQVLGVAKIIGSGEPATISTAEATNDWRSNEVDIRTLWRTGTYLDIAFIAPLGVTDYFKFYLDEATIGSSSPEFHIVLTEGGNLGGQQGLYYASYNIANVWDNPETDEIKIILPNKTITTIKKNSTIKPITPEQ